MVSRNADERTQNTAFDFFKIALNFSITLYKHQVMKPLLFPNAETKEQSKQWMHTHLQNKPEKKFK
jgi:hypothetical protein